MAYATDGQLARDTNGVPAEGVYSPGVGTVSAQAGTVQTDSVGTNYAPQVVQTNANSVVALAGNTGIPSNVPVIVQKAVAKSTGSVASLAATFTNPTLAGNSIVVVTGIGNGTDPTIADTGSNTYTKAVTGANSTTFEASIFFAVNIAGGADTVTVTNAGSTASMVVEIYEVSGLLTQVGAQPGPVITGTGTGTAVSTANIAPGSPNALVFTGVAVGTAAQTITAGTGWTNDSGQQNPTTPAGLFSFASLSQFLPNVGNVSPAATLAGSEPWAIAVAIFRPVVLGVEGTVRIAGYNYTNITTQTTTLVKGGAGVLHAIIINKPLAAGVIELDDALTHTTPVIGTITLPATLLQDGPKVGTYDVAFSTGLSITTSGATQDITVVWK